MKVPAYNIRETTIAEVASLFAAHHAYASTGRVVSYAFAVVEDERPIAAFLWQPPAPGAAKSVCSSLPCGVLSLSRMVAVPREARHLKHISKPLRHQMLRLIDRTRWPVLVTYSDESVGHTGHVYKCSGWRATARNEARTATVDGRRVSTYSAGVTRVPEGATLGKAWIQRWEHWISPVPALRFFLHWERVPTGKLWRSGQPAYTYKRRAVA